MSALKRWNFKTHHFWYIYTCHPHLLQSFPASKTGAFKIATSQKPRVLTTTTLTCRFLISSYQSQISHPRFVTLFITWLSSRPKQTASSLTTCAEYRMDNALQALLTLLSLLVAVVPLNLALYDVTTAYKRKEASFYSSDLGSNHLRSRQASRRDWSWLYEASQYGWSLFLILSSFSFQNAVLRTEKHSCAH